MAVSINRVILAGNLTRDPQVRFFANEKAVAEFGLAINRKFKGSDGQLKDETTFVDVEAWGRTAELVGQYLTKGRSCLVEGRLKLDQWEDKESGQKRNKIKVVADNVQFLDSGQRGDGPRGEGRAADGAGSGGTSGTESDASGSDSGSVRAVPSRPSASAAGAGDDEPPF